MEENLKELTEKVESLGNTINSSIIRQEEDKENVDENLMLPISNKNNFTSLNTKCEVGLNLKKSLVSFNKHTVIGIHIKNFFIVLDKKISFSWWIQYWAHRSENMH